MHSVDQFKPGAVEYFYIITLMGIQPGVTKTGTCSGFLYDHKHNMGEQDLFHTAYDAARKRLDFDPDAAVLFYRIELDTKAGAGS